MFQFTSSLRSQTKAARQDKLRENVSIHQLLTELDFTENLFHLLAHVSIHQLLTELDPHSPTVALTALKFQFTSSLRSQTISSAITQSSLHVSIHQLLTELDQRRPSDYHGAEVSIHQLLTELDIHSLFAPSSQRCFNSLAPYGARRTQLYIRFVGGFCVSIHQLLTELDKKLFHIVVIRTVFQFTSSLRSQTSHLCKFFGRGSVSIHQLLTELDRSPSYASRISWMFQFTSSLRSQTFRLVNFLFDEQCFNSLAPYGARLPLYI